MKVLITGASSFTGNVLMPMLKDAGCETFPLVRRDHGFSKQILWNFSDDLPQNIPECQAVIHLAAYVDFSDNLNLLQYIVNTVSTAKLVAYAAKTGAYFIFASMAGVHGSTEAEVDIATPVNPENTYALSKYLAEEIVRACLDNYAILRIGGIYGLGGPAHLGLNAAITNAYLRGEKPTIMGPGKAKRNYICVSDVARWIIYLLGSYEAIRCKSEIENCETFYLAGPEIMTIENYLEDIVDILLPGEEICRIDGQESKNFVIRHTPFPFTPTLFRQYLSSLRKK